MSLSGTARVPRMSRDTTTIPTGLRITKRAVCAQRPSCLGVMALFLTTKESMRLPSRAKIAGSGINAPRTAIATTAIPAYPNDLRNIRGKNIIDARVTNTVIPEKKTVRPAVATVFTIESSTLLPAWSSSRNLLTIRSE